MTATDPANLAQIRQMAQQAADLALAEYADRFARIERIFQTLQLPDQSKMEMPPLLKWTGGIITAIVTAGVIALFLWLVSSVNDMQQTLARMDERQKAQVEGLGSRFDDYDRRIRRLESYHQGGKES
ncbi:hypothetical protein ACWGM0_05090 [Sphingomonas bisphenolicum]